MDIEDPRTKNVHPVSKSLSEFVDGYVESYKTGMMSVDFDALSRAIDALQTAASEGCHIYAIGNGGSAAIADHLCCDFTKGTHTHDHPPLMSHSLSSNGPLLTAIANDFAYDKVFEMQTDLFVRKGDVLVAISSSGNSPNIVSAVERAKERGATTIGLSGFTGGALKDVADISLYVPVHNYGVVEDAHQSLMHAMAQVIAQRRDGKLAW